MRTTIDVAKMLKWKLKLMSDEALMGAYTKGSASAFECLYLRHRNNLFAFLYRQCGDESLSEELAHDTWLAVINQATFYQPSAKFKTWVYRIAHNRLVDHWRKHGSSARVLFEEISDHIGVKQDTTSQGLEIADLLKNLEVLSTEQMETLLLKIEGFSHAEIADIMNAKQETVKSRLRYATQHLRVSMEVTS